MALLWTTVDDVKDRWIGEGSVPATDEQIARLLEDAEDTVSGEFPDLNDRIDGGEIPPTRVAKVIARMVIRHIRNPEGVRSTQSTTGPFSEHVTFGGDAPGTIYLTDEDRAELAPRGVGRAFTIDPTPASVRGTYTWLTPDTWTTP